MPEFFETSVFFGVFISLISYGIGTFLNKKLKLAVFNPLLIAVIIIIAVLVLLDIDYETYNEGAKYISYLLTPATVCLAVPLYEQFELLKEHHKAVIAGIVAGVATSLCSILLFAVIFSLDRSSYELSSPGHAVRLNNKEYQLMELFMNHPRHIFSTEHLMEKIWGSNSETGADVVWTYIGFLRKKLRELGADVEIKTIRGAGYSLEECL